MAVKNLKGYLIIWLTILLMLGWGFDLPAQEGEGGESPEQVEPPRAIQEPVFPAENPKLIFHEGEDAISTTFNKEPTLNYSCSGSRTLQLNRIQWRQGGAAFYADFVFYVEESGTYELWYGGTPPGPEDEVLPSYASPFTYALDDGEPTAVYREDVAVVERYTPSYYWCLVDQLSLEAGQHAFRLAVERKRGFDNRFYFYLDCFFLVKVEDGRRVLDPPLPALFPRDLADRSGDLPFQAIEDYQIAIREESDNLEAYLELSLVYTLVSDYLNAMKYLKRAALIDPENLEVKLLTAKNLIWKGDVSKGLEVYRELLLNDPQRLGIWLEAGKVAAWTGRYDESVSFFLNGLGHFPDDPGLAVNLGLTYLWSGDKEKAEEFFTKSRRATGNDYEALKRLAEVFSINGYPQRANALYQEMIGLFPDHLEPFLLLEESYIRSNDREKAAATAKRVEATFVSSERLTRYLDIFHAKQGLKEQRIEQYRSRLEEQPDDLDLRTTLAETYFWNGFRREAISEYLNILANHAYRSLKELDQDAQDLLELIDQSHLCRSQLGELAAASRDLRKQLGSQKSAYAQAQKDYESFLAQAQKAREKGEAPPEPQGTDPQELVNQQGQGLVSLTDRARQLLDNFTAHQEGLAARRARLETVQEQEMEEEEVFQRLIRSNRWRWDRGVFLEELQGVEAAGSVLAKFVRAKIHLLEDNPIPATGLTRETLAAGVALPEQHYALLQGLLWQGQVEEALAVAEEGGEELIDYAPYLEDLIQDFYSPSPEESSGGIPAVEDQELAALGERLEGLEQGARTLSQQAERDQRLLHHLLTRRMIRRIYQLQEDTFLIRNELGDYYLKEEELAEAIGQFQQVLAIDPWDVEAVYKLGTVYEWNGDWKQAQQNYRRVFYADPLYENVATRYNRLSWEHADNLEFSAQSLAEPTRLALTAGADYLMYMNSILGMRLRYQAYHNRLYKPSDPEKPSTILVHDVAAGLPLDLYFWGLKLEPSAGLYLLNDLYTADTASKISDEVTVTDFLGFGAVELHLGMTASLGLGPYLVMEGRYRYARERDTFAPERSAVFGHTGALELSTSLAFLNPPPLKAISLRTVGEAAFLSDDNILYTAAQDINVRLFKLEKGDLQLDLLINLLYQDSKFKEEDNYYSPIQALQTGGGLALSSWFNIGEESGLGLSLRATGGPYLEYAFSEDIIKRLQLEVEGSVNFSRGLSTLSLGSMFSTSYKYSPRPSGNPWDYWSLAVILGYSTALPSLLTAE